MDIDIYTGLFKERSRTFLKRAIGPAQPRSRTRGFPQKQAKDQG